MFSKHVFIVYTIKRLFNINIYILVLGERPSSQMSFLDQFLRESSVSRHTTPGRETSAPPQGRETTPGGGTREPSLPPPHQRYSIGKKSF